MLMAGLALAALGAALALLSPPVVCHRAEVPEGQPLQLHHGCEKHHGVLHPAIKSELEGPITPPQLDKIVLQFQLDYAEQYAESKVLSAESKVLSAEKEVSHLKNLLEAKE